MALAKSALVRKPPVLINIPFSYEACTKSSWASYYWQGYNDDICDIPVLLTP